MYGRVEFSKQLPRKNWEAIDFYFNVGKSIVRR